MLCTPPVAVAFPETRYIGSRRDYTVSMVVGTFTAVLECHLLHKLMMLLHWVFFTSQRGVLLSSRLCCGLDNSNPSEDLVTLATGQLQVVFYLFNALDRSDRLAPSSPSSISSESTN